MASSKSILGALPTYLWADDRFCHSVGCADLFDVMRSRITNFSLLCSSDPRYIFMAFDILMNLPLRGKDERVILRRGFEELFMYSGVDRQNQPSEVMFETK